MKSIKQRESSVVSFNHSDTKTLLTAQTNDDHPSPTHNYTASYAHIRTNDQQILPLIQDKNYTEASLLLHELADQIEQDYMLKDELVKSYRLYVCFYNLAVIYWRIKRFQEAEKFIQQALTFLEMALSFCEYKEEHLVFTFQIIKLQLQQCVVLSQNGHHTIAAEICDRVVHRLFQCFKVKMAMANQMISDLKKKNKNKKKNGIDFKNVVLREAKEKLSYLCELESLYDMIDQSKEELHQIINKLYTWKTNLENNEKFIRMSLNIPKKENEEHRNILGITKIPDWIDDFNIGTIMALNPAKMDFKPNFDTFLLLSSNKILELVIYTSVAYFTVATQMRFKQLQLDTKQLTTSQKFLKMNDNSCILKCKVLHLKAIELAGRFMPNSNQYIAHLISSFNKNYKFYMEKIDEQNSYLVDNNSKRKVSKQKDHSVTQQKYKMQKTKRSHHSKSKSKQERRKTDAHSRSRSKLSHSRHKTSVSNISELKSSVTIRKEKNGS